MHGADVVAVHRPGEHAGSRADAAVTAAPGCTLAIRSADCVPVVLTGRHAVGVVHAGWRGLLGGVVETAVEALRSLGESTVDAHIGPCIRPGCYEFDAPELMLMRDRFGPAALSRTTWGTPALDLPAVTRGALGSVGVESCHDHGACTACDQRWFSHRARGETQRFATLAWIDGG